MRARGRSTRVEFKVHFTTCTALATLQPANAITAINKPHPPPVITFDFLFFFFAGIYFCCHSCSSCGGAGVSDYSTGSTVCHHCHLFHQVSLVFHSEAI